MTSNIGSRQLKDFGTGVGFSTSAKVKAVEEESRTVIQNALKKTFSPEFLNRIDDVIIFNQLEKEDIIKIVEIALKDVTKRIDNLGYTLEVTDAAKEILGDKGYDPAFGARPLKRVIQKYVEDGIAEKIISGELKEGGTVLLDRDETGKDIIISLKDSNQMEIS